MGLSCFLATCARLCFPNSPPVQSPLFPLAFLSILLCPPPFSSPSFTQSLPLSFLLAFFFLPSHGWQLSSRLCQGLTYQYGSLLLRTWAGIHRISARALPITRAVYQPRGQRAGPRIRPPRRAWRKKIRAPIKTPAKRWWGFPALGGRAKADLDRTGKGPTPLVFRRGFDPPQGTVSALGNN